MVQSFPYNLRVFAWLRKTYEWCMGWAEHPAGPVALCVLSASESIFFPIPVDPVLVAMGAARPKKALWFGVLASVFSVAGAAIGYFLGLWFWGATQEFFFHYVFSPATFELVLQKFQDHAFFSIFLAGFTPIPFKVFTIAAGVVQLPILPFLLGASLGRSLRFCALGGLLYFFGPSIRHAIDKYFEKITLVLAALVVGGLVIFQIMQ